MDDDGCTRVAFVVPRAPTRRWHNPIVLIKQWVHLYAQLHRPIIKVLN